MPPTWWLLGSACCGGLITSLIFWRQSTLLRAELDTLRRTLNSWNREEGYDEIVNSLQVLSRRVGGGAESKEANALLEQIDLGVRDLETRAIEVERDSAEQLCEVAAARDAATQQLWRVQTELDQVRAQTAQTGDVLRRTRAELERVRMQTSGSCEQEIMQHLAMLSAERDALKLKLKQALSENQSRQIGPRPQAPRSRSVEARAAWRAAHEQQNATRETHPLEPDASSPDLVRS